MSSNPLLSFFGVQAGIGPCTRLQRLVQVSHDTGTSIGMLPEVTHSRTCLLFLDRSKVTAFAIQSPYYQAGNVVCACM